MFIRFTRKSWDCIWKIWCKL